MRGLKSFPCPYCGSQHKVIRVALTQRKLKQKRREMSQWKSGRDKPKPIIPLETWRYFLCPETGLTPETRLPIALVVETSILPENAVVDPVTLRVDCLPKYYLPENAKTILANFQVSRGE